MSTPDTLSLGEEAPSFPSPEVLLDWVAVRLTYAQHLLIEAVTAIIDAPEGSSDRATEWILGQLNVHEHGLGYTLSALHEEVRALYCDRYRESTSG